MANDFRGYLSTVDPYALQYTGNDGLIDRTKTGYDAKGFNSFINQGQRSNGLLNGLQQYVSGLYNNYLKTQNTGSDNTMNALRQQISALQQQQAYQPKLPTFDVTGNYSRAQSQAEAAVNPLYSKYLNDYLATEAVNKQNKQQGTDLTKASDAQDLTTTLGANSVNRARTFEDTRQAIGDLNTQEGQMQQDTGTQFDTDRRAMAESNAAAGTAGSGFAAGRMFDATTARNVDEGRQVQEFNNQRAAKNLMSTRSIDDLATGDTDAQNIATTKDKAADFDLESYLEQLAGDETNFRNTNEASRLGDVATQTGTYAQQGTQQFLQSLAGAGWRPQDIALAYQVYG